MTEQSFRTCLYASGCFDPCCDAPCPKAGPGEDPCGVEQGSDECFKIVCPTCKSFQEKENVEKYTDENLSLEVKNATEGLLSNINPGNLGRPLCIIMIGDMGYYYRKLPAFDGDYDKLIETLNFIKEDFEASPKRPTTGENPLP
jgi:hypothetical protein